MERINWEKITAGTHCFISLCLTGEAKIVLLHVFED